MTPEQFIAQSDALIEAMGEPVAFKLPQTPVYAPDVPLDPETGTPFDPTIPPESGGDYDTVLVQAIKTHTTMTVDQQEESPGGLRRDESPVFIVSFQNNGPWAADAVAIEYSQWEQYHIVETRLDHHRGVPFRFLVFTEAT
jgi:hypothetical protein